MKNNIGYFLNNKRGSVTIEFFFMILFLALIFAFMADLVIIRSTMGKLDNASYSLVNLLRERSSLYEGRSDINSTDLDEYKKLAKLLLYSDKDSSNQVYVVLEYKSSNAETTLGDSSVCPPYESINTLWNLSPYSEGTNRRVARKVPLYQVTLCVETNSLFKRLLLDKSVQTQNLVRSSSMSVSR